MDKVSEAFFDLGKYTNTEVRDLAGRLINCNLGLEERLERLASEVADLREFLDTLKKALKWQDGQR